ncbi:hypothetical protein [Microlunatus speluncae]|uniref:hypothetical protein n=1 Tax=Microlunatus speluncae TaxID=2594267 RepID=UPI0012666B70|nr:hypothetical protein [Microlunatus speluncae]
MSIDLIAAERFVHHTARLLERHIFTALVHGGPIDRVRAALRPYQNADGGFGHALEPDVRGPDSQPAAVLQALSILAELDALDDPITGRAADWLLTISGPDGGVPTVLPSATGQPRAPWMQPVTESGFLTFALAGRLWQSGIDHPWLRSATDWCWQRLDDDPDPAGYTVKFALDFLDSVPDPRRAAAAVERLRPALAADGSLPVPDGVDGERVRPIELSGRPDSPSRALLTERQLETDLDRLERAQGADGGWDFEFLHWSPAQSVEWRGVYTVNAVAALARNGRLELPGADRRLLDSIGSAG